MRPVWKWLKTREWLKIHVHIYKKNEEKRETDTWNEYPEEQRHLGNTLGSQPYWKEELQGRKQSRISNEKKNIWKGDCHLYI